MGTLCMHYRDLLTESSFYRAKLEGCILGKNTHVGPKAELVRCITQAGYEVEANGRTDYFHNLFNHHNTDPY